MVSRRGWLVIIGVVGGGSIFYSTNDDVAESVNGVVQYASQEVTGPPPAETMIGTIEGPKQERVNTEGEITEEYVSLIKQIEFYESGAAKIYPKASHGCYDAMAFRHQATSLSLNADGTANTSDALITWSFGEFDEVLTVDMARAIENRRNYPNSKFVLQMVSNDGACLSASNEVEFEVPDAYMP